MINTKKKIKLTRLLKKLGDTSYSEEYVIEDLIKDINLIKETIPPKVDIAPLDTELKYLKSKYAALASLVSVLSESLPKIKKVLDERITKSSDSAFKEIKKNMDELTNRINKFQHRGGGSMPRQVQNNGTTIAVKYRDLNIIPGSGIILSSANNETYKRTDVTITSTSSSAVLTTSSTIDDSNTAFVFASLPSLIVINGAFYQQTGGAITWTWTAGTKTATLSSPVGVNGTIFGIN